MRWANLTSEDLDSLDKDRTVVILPIGSIEKHGAHLPLGTDGLAIDVVAMEVAERTGAIVLPTLYYAYVPENRHMPGTITLSGEAFLRILEEICDEVYRNGFKKILLLNGHGGNKRPLSLFLREMQAKGKRYNLYILLDPWEVIYEKIREVTETSVWGHAGEVETSYMMYLFPDLCKLERVKRPAKLGVEKIVEGVEAMTDWVGYAIEGYVGDPRKANVEKGKALFEAWVKGLVEIVEKIKRDELYDKILDEYYSKIRH